MATLNLNYVLGPLQALLGNSHNNVLLGLRIIESLEVLPGPTSDEQQRMQIQFIPPVTDVKERKALFTNWILVNGFKDINNAVRTALERLFVFRTIQLKLSKKETFDIEVCEKELRREASKANHPTLVEKVNSLFPEQLQYQNQLTSFNNARNCLEHANGIVAGRHCNNAEKNKLVIRGVRMKMFFRAAQGDVPAEFGVPGPENADLLLGAQDFEIDFSLGQRIELSSKQFADIISTCVFIRADIESKLKAAPLS